MNQKINQIKEYVPVNEVKDYWDHLMEIVTGIMPNIIYATLILLVGMWVVRIINRMVHRFFEKKDYDLTLESFLQSFINIANHHACARAFWTSTGRFNNAARILDSRADGSLRSRCRAHKIFYHFFGAARANQPTF